MASKRKLDVKSLETKYQAISEAERGGSKKAVAEKFGIPPNTLSTWIKNSEKIKAQYWGGGSERKKVRLCEYPDIEDALTTWFKAARAENIAISGPIIQAQAVKFAGALGHPEFKGTTGWLQKFKERHDIVFRTISGEAASVRQETVDKWRNTLLPEILLKFPPPTAYSTLTRRVFSTKPFQASPWSSKANRAPVAKKASPG